MLIKISCSCSSAKEVSFTTTKFHLDSTILLIQIFVLFKKHVESTIEHNNEFVCIHKDTLQ